MFRRPWLRGLRRKVRRANQKRREGTSKQACQISPMHCFWITVLAAGLFALILITTLELKLRPIAAAAATTQVQNTVTAVLEEAMSEVTGETIAYQDLVTIQRDENGQITALLADIAEINKLRTDLVRAALDHLEQMQITEIRIPAGSLFRIALFWGQGPEIWVRSVSVGTVTAQVESDFSSAGVNQTRHRLLLHILVPMTILLPDGPVEVPVEVTHCLAETVIVGQVPQYLSEHLQKAGA